MIYTRRIILVIALCVLSATTLITLMMPLNYRQYQSRTAEKEKDNGCGASRRPLYVGVVSSNEKRAHNVYNTWGKYLSNGSIHFYMNTGGYEPETSLPIVEVPLAYNLLLKKSFYTYKHMYEHIDCHDWFIRADDDIYLRIPQILKFISNRNPSKPHYIGQQGAGKPNDLPFLKLKKSDRYCMGGSGVIISRELLKRIGPHLDTCLENDAVSYHDDVEFGRCVIRKLGIQCAPGYVNRFHHDYSDGAVFTSDGKLKKNKMKRLPVHKMLTFHPLKTTEKMNSIHEFFTHLKKAKI